MKLVSLFVSSCPNCKRPFRVSGPAWCRVMSGVHCPSFLCDPVLGPQCWGGVSFALKRPLLSSATVLPRTSPCNGVSVRGSAGMWCRFLFLLIIISNKKISDTHSFLIIWFLLKAESLTNQGKFQLIKINYLGGQRTGVKQRSSNIACSFVSGLSCCTLVLFMSRWERSWLSQRVNTVLVLGQVKDTVFSEV